MSNLSLSLNNALDPMRTGARDWTRVFGLPCVFSLVSAMSAAGPSAVSRQIGEIVAMAETRKVDLAVTGVSPLKTRVSLMKGLEIHKGRYLSNLRVLYIGPPSDRDAVEEAVRSVGGQFFFAERESI